MLKSTTGMLEALEALTNHPTETGNVTGFLRLHRQDGSSDRIGVEGE